MNSVAAPKQFIASITLTKRFRFQCSGTTPFEATLNPAELAGLQSVVLTNTTAQPLIQRLRIRSFELFGPMPASLIPVTVELEYLGASNDIFDSASKIHTDTSMTASCCAHVHRAPDEESVASKWLNPTAPNFDVVRISGPPNMIVDIVLDIVYNDGEAPPSVITIAATTQPIGSVGVVSPDSRMNALGLPALTV